MEYMSEKTNEIAQALSNVQKVLENVVKDQQAYNYKYANLASCLNAIKEPLGENGLALTQLPCMENGEFVLNTLLLHTSGQWLKSTFPLRSGSGGVKENAKINELQTMGAAISYARRYSLAAMVGLAQEDNDGSNNQRHAKEEAERAKLLKEFRQKCEEYNVNMKHFAIFHNISSQNIGTVAHALANFDDLYHTFVESVQKEEGEML